MTKLCVRVAGVHVRTSSDEEIFFGDLNLRRRFGRRGGELLQGSGRRRLGRGEEFLWSGGFLFRGGFGGDLRGGWAEASERFGDGFPESLTGLAGANGLVLLLNAGNGIEKELREVADGEGVAAVNALASELLDGVGEEGVDAVGGVEVAGRVEKFGGDGFGIGLRGEVLLKVMGAKGVMRGSDGQAAAATGGVEVSALVGASRFGRHKCFLSKKK